MTLAQVDIKDTFFGNNPRASNIAGTTINDLVSHLLPNVLVVAGLIFFVLILGAGFALIQAAGGQGSPQDAAKARNAMTFALVGFLLVIGAYFILQAVGAMVGIDFTNLPNI